jgi:hypothetical protein
MTMGSGMYQGTPEQYQVGGYGAAANPMGSMRGRFADLRGIHQQTHGGGYASDERRQPVLVHERSYYTDQPPRSLGHLFQDAPGVKDSTISRLRNAMLGVFEDR